MGRLLRARSDLLHRALAGACALGALACGGEDGGDAASGVVRRPLVEVATATAAEPTYRIVSDGFLEPLERTTLSAEVSGRIDWVAPTLRPGGRFAAGEPLVRIESRVYEAERDRASAGVEGARAARREAAASLGRLKRLEGTGATAEEQRETAEAALEAAEAEVAAAQARFALADERLQDTEVRAPFDSGVLSESATRGRYVAPGTPLAEVFDRSAVVVVGLPLAAADALRRRIASGSGPIAVEVHREGRRGDPREGRVSAIEPALDRRSRTLNVRVRIDDAFDAEDGEPFLVGEFVEVTLLAESDRPTFDVPAEAVRRDGHVYVVDDDSVLRRREVDVLDRTGGSARVASGAPLDGARVLLTALPEETDGLRVRVAGDDGEAGDNGEDRPATGDASGKDAE